MKKPRKVRVPKKIKAKRKRLIKKGRSVDPYGNTVGMRKRLLLANRCLAHGRKKCPGKGCAQYHDYRQRVLERKFD